MNILLIVIIGLSWCGVGIVMSQVANEKLSFTGFMGFSGIISSLLLWIFVPNYKLIATEGLPDLSYMPFFLFVGTLLSTVGFRIMNYAMKLGHHGATWTIGQSALIFPFFFSMIYYSEKPTTLNLIGVALALCSMVLLSKNSDENSEELVIDKSSNKNNLLWLITAFTALAFIGTQQIFYLIPFHWSDWTDRANLAAPIGAIASAGSNVVFNLLGDNDWQWKKYWKKAVVLSVIAATSQVLLMIAINRFSAENRSGLLFPCAIGVCTMSFSFYSIFILKEKTSVMGILGMILGTIAIVFIAL